MTNPKTLAPWVDRSQDSATLRVLSLGAGVQSSVMALKASREELTPRPDFAIFADTKWEPREIYDHLEWLRSQVDFPVYIVSKGNLREDQLKALGRAAGDGERFSSMPLFTESGGMARRSCTRDYKVEPIQKKLREFLGVEKGKRVPKGVLVEMWIGISRDEIMRCKDSNKGWITNRWPLIEKDMSRRDCVDWFASNFPGRNLHRSACIGCPFRHDGEWLEMKEENAEAWKDAIEFDAQLRASDARVFGMKDHQYLHRKRVPLNEVPLSEGQKDPNQFSMLDECEGMCGV